MRRIAIVSVLLFVSVNIFAIDFPDFSISTGGGVLLGHTFTRYKLEGGDLVSKQNMNRYNLGGFIFADFTYAEFSISFQAGNSRYDEQIYNDVAEMIAAGTGQELSIGFALLGKYPFRINEQVTWFPLLGIEYLVSLRQLRKPDDGDYAGFWVDRTEGRLMEDLDKDGNTYSASAWNSWNIILGAGLDFNITRLLFFRGEFLFGFRLPTAYEMSALDLVEDKFGVSNVSLGGINGSPTLKLAVGYRFKRAAARSESSINQIEEYIEQEAVSPSDWSSEYAEIEEKEEFEEIESSSEQLEEQKEIENIEHIEEIEEIEEGGE